MRNENVCLGVVKLLSGEERTFRLWRKILFGCLMIGIFLLPIDVNAKKTDARTLNVPGDYATVNEALEAANDGDKILITGTHIENYIFVEKNVTICGVDASTSVVRGLDSNDFTDGLIFFISTDATVTISDLTITLGKEIEACGGIFNLGNLALENCRITENSGIMGGGIASFGMLTIDSCCIDNNTAYVGGGVYCEDSMVSMVNSTISNNNATGGAGLYVYEDGIAVIDSCTIVENTAIELGGGVMNDGDALADFGIIVVQNTIIADNQALIYSDVCDSIISNDYNLIENNLEVTIIGQTENNIYGKDPLLESLADYGGPVPTHALQADSPALNAGGTILTVDGRGVTRPQGSESDIGAFESRTFTVTFSAKEYGSVSGETTQSVYEYNDCSTVTAVPDTDYHFLSWTKDDVFYSADKALTVTSVTGDMSLVANFSKDTYKVVFSTDGPGSLEGETVQNMKYGEVCSVVRAIPDSSKSSFVKWTCTNGEEYTNSSLIFGPVVSSVELTAHFSSNQYVITATSSDGGSISESGKVNVAGGASVKFTMTPDTGYYLKRVLVDDVSVGAVSSYTFLNVSSDHTIHAVFSTSIDELFTITSEVEGTGGVINPSGSVPVEKGDDVTLTIIADDGYMIDDVSVDSSSVGAVESYTFTGVTTNHRIQAVFKEIPSGYHLIVASCSSGGEITPEGQVLVQDGTDATFTIAADDKYTIDDVNVDSLSVGAVDSYTFSKVTTNHRIEVDFALKTYMISVTAGDGGTVEPSGEIVVDADSSQLLVFTPDAGWHVEDVIIDGTSFGPLAEYEFTHVRSDHIVEVQFAEGVETLYVINATSANGGTVSPYGRVSVPENGSMTFVILPEYTKQIKDVQVDGVSVGAVESYTFSQVTSSHTLATYFEDAESIPDDHCLFGIKMNDPSGGWLLPKAGKYHVQKGVSLALEVLPGEKHVFTGWEVLGDGEMSQLTSRTGTITINGNTEVMAMFENVLPNIALTASASPVRGCNTIPCGTVTVNAEESQALSARSKNGFTFKEWVFTEGSGTISSSESIDTHVTPLTDSRIMAVLENPDVEFKVNVVAEGWGIVEPSGETTVSAGSSLDITANPASGQHFLRWTTTGSVIVIGPNSTDTQAIITGDCEIKALFAEEDETVSLTINEYDTGDSTVEYLLRGDQRVLKARVPAYKAFYYWDYQQANSASMKNEVCPIDNIYSPVATLTATEDLVVNARFIKNSMTVERAQTSRLNISLRNDRVKSDSIRIVGFPCDASGFDPENDSVTVLINGNDYVFQAGSFRRVGKKQIWKAVTKSVDGHPQLLINADEQSWSFKGRKMDLSYVSSTEALNVAINWGTRRNTSRIIPQVETKCLYIQKAGDMVDDLDVVGDELAAFEISSIHLKLGSSKESRNSISAQKFTFTFPENATDFDPLSQTVELKINNISILVPPGSFELKQNENYVFQDRENKISISLNLGKGEGRFVINYLERTGLVVDSNYLDIYLRIGSYSKAIRTYFGNERTVLKWNK